MSRFRRGRLIIPAIALGITAAFFAPRAAYAQASAPFVQIPAEQSYRALLERHGQFYSHDQYGIVWVPTSMPQGWRPYSDCKWVQHKTYGWLYDDRTEWGRIVHHYGRWAHDERVGWMWIAGAEWSPGWVVWRNSETHIGWAPMPPDSDVVKISVEQFNSDKHWMFREQAEFKSGCATRPVLDAPLAASHFRDTRIVTKTRFVNGVFIYEVPVVAVQVMEFDVGVVLPWSPAFIGAIFANWNHVWNDVSGQAALLNAALNQCTIDRPDRKLNLPTPQRINAPPAPPAPSQRRSELPPAPPPVVGPPVSPPVFTPPVVDTPTVVVRVPTVIVDIGRRAKDPERGKGKGDTGPGDKPTPTPTHTPGAGRTGQVKPTPGSGPNLVARGPRNTLPSKVNTGATPILRKAGPPPGPKFTPALRSQPIQRFTAPQRSFQPVIRSLPRSMSTPRAGFGGGGRNRLF